MTGHDDARSGFHRAILTRVRINPRDTRLIPLSKRKVRVRMGGYNVVVHESDPLIAEIKDILIAYRLQQRLEREGICVEDSHRAMLLLHEIVRRHECLSINSDEVTVECKNGWRYAISLRSCQVYRLEKKRRQRVCVTVYPSYLGNSLPYADRIIAIALTIAYAPSLIPTL